MFTLADTRRTFIHLLWKLIWKEFRTQKSKIKKKYILFSNDTRELGFLSILLLQIILPMVSVKQIFNSICNLKQTFFSAWKCTHNMNIHIAHTVIIVTWVIIVLPENKYVLNTIKHLTKYLYKSILKKDIVFRYFEFAINYTKW